MAIRELNDEGRQVREEFELAIGGTTYVGPNVGPNVCRNREIQQHRFERFARCSAAPK